MKYFRRIVAVILVIVGIVMAVIYGKEPLQEYTQTVSSSKEVHEDFINDNNEPDVDNMIEFNRDAIAWMRIDDTKVDDPVVLSKDNDDYLRHDLYGKYSRGGTLFIDCHTSNPFHTGNTIVYGHNLANGLKFSLIKRYKDEDFRKKHQIVKVFLKSGEYQEYRIFAMGKVRARDTQVYDAVVYDQETLDNYYNNVIKKHNFLDDAFPKENKPLLMLSTCTNANKSERYVVWAYLETDLNTEATE